MTELQAIDGFVIRAAEGAGDMDSVRELFREYQQWLGVDLCFQDFEAELAGLPGFYAPPKGRLYLVREQGSEALVGCVGLRPLSDALCEMKRLYVRDRWRGHGLGRALAERLVTEARGAGYGEICLDTLKHLHAARALYADMGFRETPPYYDNPLEGVTYLSLSLA
ncbi:MAG: GNAT family N-acetyltransferase [Rhodospirillaceae bacterium]